MLFDCVIVGGGIAGLQAGIQLGRYKHRILIIDSNNGRSSICHGYHNILGYPDGVSGVELRGAGKKQCEALGVVLVEDTVVSAKKIENYFILTGQQGQTYSGKTLLFATGVMDRIPDFPSLYPCLGISVYVCPDCDGYEIKNKSTIVIGSGNVGANMALILSYWTDKLIFVNHEEKPVSEEKKRLLDEKKIRYYSGEIAEVLAEGSNFQGVRLKNGKMILSSRAFIAMGGNEVRSAVAAQLGVELHQNKHILVDPRTKKTNIENVWAAGDIAAHSEQVTIAMGDGSQAGIWIHKSLM
ncbi:NAD(P)/FAD-dependent oxidoreductase [Heyndrickxia acidicola]|uniref:NAD(P)/FAD-dependent oxidoreductase n=1 Tax=Heyndrickxia acidicola TaxID=209389 RepID=A0ABU6MGM1_9BACI|nr:NAD(P)/FAD-dependent oxidoreductase [Heyndrickxia acidicola]MED1202813.1 NAD(P)/FAD-dependent oxidoreductase [Heyndrickxia acidicola]